MILHIICESFFWTFDVSFCTAEAAEITMSHRYLAIATSGGLNQQRTGVLIFGYALFVFSYGITCLRSTNI